MHLEMLEDRREMQQGKIQDLQRELETIQSQQHQLQEEQRAESQQAVDTEGELSQASLSKAEREELEARRADLQALSPTRFVGAQNALTQREARARERLAIQEQRVRADRTRASRPVTREAVARFQSTDSGSRSRHGSFGSRRERKQSLNLPSREPKKKEERG